MLCCVGLVVDVGHAMLVQRQLQAGVDAAALAGVQHLPDEVTAESVAQQYSATPGSKNAVNTVDNAVTSADAKCIAGIPGCNRRDGGVNGIVVTSSSTVPTWFGRVIGINELKVSATATACSPCSVKPLDVMIVLDRTGSMCQIQGQSDPSCTDLNRAKDGIETFLSYMDPTLDKVGLALTPPTINAQMISRCPYKPWNGNSNPNPPPSSMNGRYYGYDQWWDPNGDDAPNGQDSSHYVVASLEGADGFPDDDYLVLNPSTGDWELNYSQSAVLQRLGCTLGAGSTSYALAIDDAQWELSRNGRGNVQDVIIFLSDGAANTSPLNVPTAHWTNNGTGPNSWFNRPCGSGVEAASRVKGPNNTATIVYTIGYDLGVAGGTTERCQRPDSNGHQDTSSPVPESAQSWGSNAEQALKAMASPSDLTQPVGPSNPPRYYWTPDGLTLNQIFQSIAIDLSGARARLVDNTAPNLIG
jgi:Flp pilus assembly protein TadG